MLPLGFVIFPLLIKSIIEVWYRKNISTFFFSGFFFGFGFFSILLSWIYNPFLVYDSTKPFVILSIFFPLFLSIFFGLTFIIYNFIRNIFYIIFLTPFIFVFIEFFLSNFLYGFPWISFSLILSNNFIGFYIIKYFGTLVSGFCIIAIFLIPTFFVYKNKINNKKKLFILAYLPFIIGFILPLKYINSSDDQFIRELNIDIYQIFSPIKKINREKVEKEISNLIDSSDSDYIIFAENNYPYLISKTNINHLFKKIINEKKVIIGATTENDGNYYNSFLFLEADNIQYFDKKILVPFGEFLPFRKYLQFMNDISGDKDFKIGNIDRLLTSKDKFNILPAICYEIIFDQIFKNINENKIDFIINITNDSWFGKKVGPYQHFYITRIKSLIANKPILRISNNGISAVIDNNAKIVKFTKLNQEDNLKLNLKVKYNKNYIFSHNILSLYLLCMFIILIFYNVFYKNYEK